MIAFRSEVKESYISQGTVTTPNIKYTIIIETDFCNVKDCIVKMLDKLKFKAI